MLKIIMIMFASVILVNAETTVSVYTVPLGSIGALSQDGDVEEIVNKINSDGRIIATYKKKTNSKILVHKDIRVVFKNKENKKQNYNSLVEALEIYSEEDSMLVHKDIRILFKNKQNKKQNYNSLIEALEIYSKNMHEIDSELLKKMLNRFKAD